MAVTFLLVCKIINSTYFNHARTTSTKQWG